MGFELLPDAPGVNPKDLQGRKKAPLHLIPPVALVHESMAMRDGAAKYGPYNWRENRVLASVYYSAAMRHLACYWDGEDSAADSRVHHLAHARACLGILLDAMSIGQLADDRPVAGGSARLIQELIDAEPQA